MSEMHARVSDGPDFGRPWQPDIFVRWYVQPGTTTWFARAHLGGRSASLCSAEMGLPASLKALRTFRFALRVVVRMAI